MLMGVKRWFKLKRYAHIGLPLQYEDKNWLVHYITDPAKIASHRFTPLIKRCIKSRKYRAAEPIAYEDSKAVYQMNPYGKRVRVVMEPKERPIYYANHMDSLIYSYYSYVMSVQYEWYIRHKPFNSCAVAYRQIRKSDGQKGNKSNIEFAYDAFKAIVESKSAKISVIVADISNFFDELDHEILHRQWKRVLSCKTNRSQLPKDHYNVFRSLTKKRFVELHELHNACYKSIWVERCLPNNPKKTEWKQKKVAKRRNFRRERVVAFCTKKEFLEKHLNLVRSDRRGALGDGKFKSRFSAKGIPQGSPMSAVLANIYMLDFDEMLYQYTKDFGFYQRYSDDMIIICPREKESETLEIMKNAVADPEKCNLTIHDTKTKVYRYEMKSSQIIGGIAVPDTDRYDRSRQLEYLGFQFTGSNVYVKTQGISKYYRSMIRSIKRGKYYARKAHLQGKGLFKNKLIRRFTMLGGKRILRRIPDPHAKGQYIPDPEKRYNWGNYFSYLLKADFVMRELNNGQTSIKKQTRKFEQNFRIAMKHPKTELRRRTKKG